MTHCDCDPKFEVSPSPLFFLSFSLGVAFMPPHPSPLTVRSFAFEGLSEWGALSGLGSGVGCTVL